RAYGRADDVVASLDDRAGQVADAWQPVEDLIRRDERIVDEVMRLDAGDRERARVPVQTTAAFRLRQQCRARTLVAVPRLRGRLVNARIGIGQSTIIMRERVGALLRRKEVVEIVPGFRKDASHAADEPFDLAARREKDAAQNETEHARRMRLRVNERQCRSPGSTEQQPALDAETGA